jgi:hypothetical protein
MIITAFGVSLFLVTSSVVSAVEVPRWQPQDFVFSSDAKPSNPFSVAFSATARGPDGATFETSGFYDGGAIWKVRVAPGAGGEWSLTTHSDIPDLDNKTCRFRCVGNTNSQVHGRLLVDPKHRHHFMFEDGSRCFLMGYECDWLWALDSNGPGLPTSVLKTLEPLLDKLQKHGFNCVILNAYAYDTAWRKGKTGPDDYGPPPLYAWGGSNAQPDHSRFNLEYWQHYDKVIEALNKRGMIAHLMIKVYNKQVRWPVKESAEDDLYFRWLIARYAAFPNVVWDLAKEANYEKSLQYKTGRLRFIRKNDPYHRLLTVHTDAATYDSGAYDKLLDYRTDQVHANWHASILKHRVECAWPVLNSEFGYEHGPAGPKDMTYGVAQSPEEVCRRAWQIYLAGGYGAYYYTYAAWDVVRPNDTPPGYAYFRHLSEFFADTSYWLLEPSDALVSDGLCLAQPGKEYVVYMDRAKPFSLKLAGLAAPLASQWYQPLTGKRIDGARLDNGNVELTPPVDWNGPLALHVGERLKSQR